jgi:DNA-directed RNA polymerase specialized sigma24 family protein
MTVVGVEEALRAAYEEHYVPLLRLCVLLCGDRQAAEDIVQDAFVKIAPIGGRSLRRSGRTCGGWR